MTYGSTILDMLERLPALEDDALKNLHANAQRLGQSGTTKQKTSAAALLPAIVAELDARKAAKKPVKAAAAPKAAKKPAAKRPSRAKVKKEAEQPATEEA